MKVTGEPGISRCLFLLFFIATPLNRATAVHLELAGWKIESEQHPDGVSYSRGDAKLMRFSVSSIDFTGGGL